MELLSKILIDFAMNGAIEALVIATIAYKIVGYIMNSANYQ